MWARVRNKLSFLSRSDRFDRELTEELDFHREMLEHDKAREGLDPETAAQLSRRQLGNLTVAREASRDSWIFAWLDAFGCDFRLVTRSLMHAKGFTTAAVLTFALGIGANIAVFTVLDRLMFRPLPFPAPERLVQLHEFTERSESPSAMLLATVGARVRAQTRTIDDLAYTRPDLQRQTIDGLGDSPIIMASATANLLHVLGITPFIGHDFTNDDNRSTSGPTEILISHRLWRTRLGASDTVIDRIVGRGRRLYTIVGVLPADFLLPSSLLAERTDVLAVDANSLAGSGSPGEVVTAPIGRLRQGVTIAQARAEIAAIVDATRREALDGTRSAPPRRADVVVQPLQQGLFFLYARYLWVVVSAVALVLLVACVNMATLLLARGRAREHETAVRVALGASPRRVIALSVLESMVLCVAGSAVALAVCWWIQAALIAAVPPSFRSFAVNGADLRLIALTLVVAFVSALVAAIGPALMARRVGLVAVLQRNDPRTKSRLRGGATLLAVEAALGVILVTGAATTVPGFASLLKNPGFEPADLFALQVNHGASANGEGFSYTPQRVRDTLDIVRMQPGVSVAGAATRLPFGGYARASAFWDSRGIDGGQWGVSADAFTAFGTPFKAGRDFTPEEVDSQSRVAILNERAVQTIWPDTNSSASALGQTLTVGDGAYTVVGVVADIQALPGVAPLPGLFVPITDHEAPVTQSSLTVAVRMVPGHEPSAQLFKAGLAARFGPAAALSSQKIIDDLLEPRLQRPRFLALLFGALAAIAMILAAVGIYAVTNFETSHRRYEMAVRVALGATRGEIRRLVFSRAARPVCLGALVGAAIAWRASSVLETLVAGVTLGSPWTLALVALTIVGVGMLACGAPAQRLAKTDATILLRES